jgi:CubicO group peptidase (beta-lactamase class C family)
VLLGGPASGGELLGPGAKGSGDVQVPASAGRTASIADIDAHLRRVVAAEKLEGAAVIIGRIDAKGSGTDVLRGFYGTYGPDTVEPVASLSKWVTAATIASLVDAGQLRFDDPISQFIKDVPADKKAITVRQALSHLSGIPGVPIQQEVGRRDLAEAAANALRLPSEGAPGTVFVYSGAAMQVAARAAEIAGKDDFRTLFRRRIAEPLGMRRSEYRAFSEGKGAPAVGGDLVSTPTDMERFTRMLASGGVHEGRRVLSKAVIDDMARVIGAKAEPRAVPRMAQRYPGTGTGLWCERVAADGRCTSIAAIGAFGGYSWVDYDRGLYGVMFVKTDPIKILKHWRAVRAAVEGLDAQRPAR